MPGKSHDKVTSSEDLLANFRALTEKVKKKNQEKYSDKTNEKEKEKESQTKTKKMEELQEHERKIAEKNSTVEKQTKGTNEETGHNNSNHHHHENAKNGSNETVHINSAEKLLETVRTERELHEKRAVTEGESFDVARKSMDELLNEPLREEEELEEYGIPPENITKIANLEEIKQKVEQQHKLLTTTTIQSENEVKIVEPMGKKQNVDQQTPKSRKQTVEQNTIVPAEKHPVKNSDKIPEQKEQENRQTKNVKHTDTPGGVNPNPNLSQGGKDVENKAGKESTKPKTEQEEVKKPETKGKKSTKKKDKKGDEKNDKEADNEKKNKKKNKSKDKSTEKKKKKKNNEKKEKESEREPKSKEKSRTKRKADEPESSQKKSKTKQTMQTTITSSLKGTGSKVRKELLCKLGEKMYYKLLNIALGEYVTEVLGKSFEHSGNCKYGKTLASLAIEEFAERESNERKEESEMYVSPRDLLVRMVSNNVENITSPIGTLLSPH